MEDKVICNCMDIKYEELIKEIIEHNLTTVEDVQKQTEAGTVCGLCIDEIQTLLDTINSKK